MRPTNDDKAKQSKAPVERRFYIGLKGILPRKKPGLSHKANGYGSLVLLFLGLHLSPVDGGSFAFYD